MSRFLLFFACLFLVVDAIAQSGIELRAYYGISGSSVARKVELVGASDVEMNRVMELGFTASRSMGEKVRVNTGINYTFGKVSYISNSPPCVNCLIGYDHNPNFRMVSVPLFGEIALGKVFYAGAGPLVDFQLSEKNNFTRQSGLGYLVGLGARASAGNFVFSLFSNYKRHGVAPFVRSMSQKFIFQELGMQMRVGYRF